MRRLLWCLVLGAVAGLCGAAAPAPFTAPAIELPPSGIRASELAVVINERDALSRAIGRYYQQKRGIPQENVIRVSLPPGKHVLTRAEFAALRQDVAAATGANIQAYALAWVAPYRVDCMSITSAFAFGFDDAYCASGCNPTRRSPYYNTATIHPRTEVSVMPTMMLAAETFEQAKRLIDRGVRADGRLPRGDVYLLETSDSSRSVRAQLFPAVVKAFGGSLRVHWEQADSIQYKTNVLFYFTGLTHVEGIGTNHFLPGAMADHLTSAGGDLIGGSQMSALRWLEQGATASYGAVVEPCNFIEKFPNPLLAIYYYLRGNTLIEAYWKSVAMPGQGVFIGEPLAQPYRGYVLRRLTGSWLLTSPALTQGEYRVLAADRPDGDYGVVVDSVPVLPMQPGIVLAEPLRAAYRIEML